MTKNYVDSKPKIRGVVIFFSMFMALMLFQTSLYSLGTITAIGTMVLTVLSFFLSANSDKKISFCNTNILLLSFILFVFLTSAISLLLPSYRLISQALFCVFLFSIELNVREARFVRNVFIIASVFYAILTIYSCVRLGDDRYVHGGIELFGTTLDPNFIGIPLVASTPLLLDNLMHRRRIVFSALGLAILLVAIFYTSSRGNLLAVVVACGLLGVIFLFESKVSLIKKLVIIAIVTTAVFFIFDYLAAQMDAQWERLSDFGENADNGRFELWDAAIEVWQDNMFIGVGNGGFYALTDKATHNTYLAVLAETGLLGAVLFFAFLYNMCKKSFKYDKSMFVMFVGVLFHIFFVDALDNRCVWVIMCWIAMLPGGRIRNEEV